MGTWKTIPTALSIAVVVVTAVACSEAAQPRSQPTSVVTPVAVGPDIQSLSEVIDVLAQQVEALAVSNASTVPQSDDDAEIQSLADSVNALAEQVRILAASNASTIPQTDDDAEIQSLADSVNALAEQVKTLAASNQTLAEQIRVMPVQESSPREASSTPATDSGICSRTPEVQEAILVTLRLSSCRFVTDDELYRIREWRSLSGSSRNDIDWITPPQPGDFSGLVNLQFLTGVGGDFTLLEGTFQGLSGLKHLNVIVSAMDPGAFQGLSGLKYLNVKVSAVAPGAFQGLPALEHLEVSIGAFFDTHDGDPPLRTSVPVLDEMPNLKTLTIHTEGDTTLVLTGDQFSNLPSLETIGIGSYSDREDIFILPAGLFQQNAALKYVEINVDYPSDIRAPVDLFAGLHNLESLRIYGSDSDSVLAVMLSTKSPLFNDLLNRNASPDGYTLVWPETQ